MNPGATSQERDAYLIEFGVRLRELRVKAGLTQESLADAAGLHWSYVGQVERGERNLTYKSILSLAEGLGVDPAHLMPKG